MGVEGIYAEGIHTHTNFPGFKVSDHSIYKTLVYFKNFKAWKFQI